jgi:DNA-binding HxlR family transcriptional regulator
MSAYTSPRLLDQFDIFLLVAISNGVSSNAYLADSSGQSRSTISARIKVLEKYNLVKIRETNQKHFAREYVVSPLAQELVSDLYFDFNSNYLSKLKKLSINQKLV